MATMDSLGQQAGITGEMPRFDDGTADIQELIRIMAESLVNGTMDAQAEDACADGNQRNGYRERSLVTSVGTISLRTPQARAGHLLPRLPARAPLAYRPRGRRRGPRDGRGRGFHQEGGKGRLRPWGGLHGREPGVESLRVARRDRRGHTYQGPLRHGLPPTSGSMRPTSNAEIRATSPRARSSPPSAPARAATGACSDSMPSTRSPMPDGRRLCARCASGVLRGPSA